ncbi:MAG: hypothetical protein HQL10_00840 [Nitrospirae bacterium]|nr:hypothetical protein [Nitrospirota bacterium]
MRYLQKKESEQRSSAAEKLREHDIDALLVGGEPIKDENKLKTRLGTLVMLTPTDSVKDRLAAFYHWNDPQALEQAVMVAKAQKINIKEVKRWSDKEGNTEKYQTFLNLLKSKTN